MKLFLKSLTVDGDKINHDWNWVSIWSGFGVSPTWTAPSKLQCFSLETAILITFALIDFYLILIGGVSLPARNFVGKLQDGGPGGPGGWLAHYSEVHRSK